MCDIQIYKQAMCDTAMNKSTSVWYSDKQNQKHVYVNEKKQMCDIFSTSIQVWPTRGKNSLCGKLKVKATFQLWVQSTAGCAQNQTSVALVRNPIQVPT